MQFFFSFKSVQNSKICGARNTSAMDVFMVSNPFHTKNKVCIGTKQE